MTCEDCTGFAQGGCVRVESSRKYDSADRTPCDLFAPPVVQPKPIKYEVPRAWYVQQALDAVKER